MNKTLIYGFALTATLGGFLFGYDTAVISDAINALDVFFVQPWGWSETVANFVHGLIVSAALLGCVLGSALGGWCSQRFGRKRSLFLAALLFFVSAVGSAYPEAGFGFLGWESHQFFPFFIFYRILGGVGTGLASMLSPMYIAEIAPPAIRGKLVSWNQMAIVTGILSVFFINYLIASQGDTVWLDNTGWRIMFLSSAAPALLFFALLFAVPESPRWLLIRGFDRRAAEVLQRLDPRINVNDEIQAIQASLSPQKTTKAKSTPKRRMWIAGILLAAFQQLVGIQVIIYFAPVILEHVTGNSNLAMLQAVLVGAVNFIFTIVAIYTIDRVGRKTLLLWGSGLMSLFMLALAFGFYTQNLGVPALICILGYVASFAFSWGPAVWVLLSEMFPNAVRNRIMSVTVAVLWITDYLVSQTFPMLDKSSWLVEKFNHAFSFGLFALMSLLSGIFVWKMLPETKSKSLEEIEKIW
jgi:SP family xylose:H+ symportor-like MFS transporter